jgi:superfamily I DNA/RNA helicase
VKGNYSEFIERRAELLERVAAGRRESAQERIRAARLGGYIESRKHRLLRPGEELPQLGPGAPRDILDSARGKEVFAPDPALDEAYAAYRAELRSRNALDFDDLVTGAVRLLSARPGILAEYRKRFTAFMVDEYQDVNFAQYALVRLLSDADPGSAPAGAAPRSLFVIGDPNQSIYGFRGSDPRFIERFTIDFPGAAVYRLTRSFRCAAPIIEAAGRIASAELTGSGGAVSLFRREYPTAEAEAEGIARLIDRMIGGTRFFAMDSGVASGGSELRSLGECAVLVRASALIDPIVKALADHGIPCETLCEPEPKAEPPERSLADLVKPERVRIMTIHASKGLEFDHVFVAGLEDGVLPFTIYENDESEGGAAVSRLEEERRILYVAMTRARRGLHLSWARTRLFRGRRLELEPSRFLSEIDDIVPLDVEDAPRRRRDPQLNLF